MLGDRQTHGGCSAGGAADSPQEFYRILFSIILNEQFFIFGKSSRPLSPPDSDEKMDISLVAGGNCYPFSVRRKKNPTTPKLPDLHVVIYVKLLLKPKKTLLYISVFSLILAR